MNYKSILLIQLRQVGDVLLTTPALRAIRRHFPGARVDFLTETMAARVLEGNTNIDTLIVRKRNQGLAEELRMLGDLRRRKYDLVLDFLGNPRSAIISLLTGAPERIGFDFRFRQYLYTTRVKRTGPQRYTAIKKFDLLRPLGITVVETAPDIFVEERDFEPVLRFLGGPGAPGPAPMVTISPVSRKRYKIWPKHRFAELGKMLSEKAGAKVVVLWGPGERKYAEEVAGAMGPGVVLSPDLNLKELCALYFFTTLHAGNDNGHMHIAAACGVPTVTVFGPTDPCNWNPPGERHVAVRSKPDCAECDMGTCEDIKCLEMIEAGTVFEEARKLLASHGG
jgi:heptosyltransferase-3